MHIFDGPGIDARSVLFLNLYIDDVRAQIIGQPQPLVDPDLVKRVGVVNDSDRITQTGDDSGDLFRAHGVSAGD